VLHPLFAFASELPHFPFCFLHPISFLSLPFFFLLSTPNERTHF